MSNRNWFNTFNTRKTYYSKSGIPWVTPTDITSNVIFSTERHLSKGEDVARVVPKNTILVTCIASIGKNTLLGTTGSFNQQINGIIPNEKKYNPYFLYILSSFWSSKMKGLLLLELLKLFLIVLSKTQYNYSLSYRTKYDWQIFQKY